MGVMVTIMVFPTTDSQLKSQRDWEIGPHDTLLSDYNDELILFSMQLENWPKRWHTTCPFQCESTFRING